MDVRFHSAPSCCSLDISCILMPHAHFRLCSCQVVKLMIRYSWKDELEHFKYCVTIIDHFCTIIDKVARILTIEVYTQCPPSVAVVDKFQEALLVCHATTHCIRIRYRNRPIVDTILDRLLLCDARPGKLRNCPNP